MDKIIVQPENVRGLGDVLSPKSASDFEEYLSTLTSSTDTVNGASMTVYSLEYNGSPAPTPASISLTSDKSILSYADSQSATLSATVLDADSGAIEGASVEFFKGSTSLGTADTNSSGVATKTYASTGAGDLSFTASVGSLVSETYSIEDCYLYDTCSTNKTSNYSTDGTLTFDTDHYVFTGSNKKVTLCSTNDSVQISAEVWSDNRNVGIGFYNDSNNYVALYGVSNGTGLGYNTNGSFNSKRTSGTISKNTYYKYYLTQSGGTITGSIYTMGDSKFGEWTYSHANYNTEILWNAWENTMYVKNIKVKKL